MKTHQFVSFIFALTYSLSIAFSQTNISIVTVTGSDDLRNGNAALITINFTDGTSSEELTFGRYFKQNYRSRPTSRTFDRSFSLSEIQSITIRHDGSPTNAFETYDNWDLQTLRVSLVTTTGTRNIYNSARDPDRRRFVHRFTGESRQIVLNRQP